MHNNSKKSYKITFLLNVTYCLLLFISEEQKNKQINMKAYPYAEKNLLLIQMKYEW
jgi:hypothetical protein